MSSPARKLQKRLRKEAGQLDFAIGAGERGTAKAKVVLRRHPVTGEMTEYHLTKGWKN